MEYLFRKTERRDILTAAEKQALANAVDRTIDVPARQVTVREMTEVTHSQLLLEGFACRYKDLPNGQRQILELHVPGDFIDLHGFLLKHLDHTIGTLTPARIALVPHDRLQAITVEHPHLTRMLWFGTLLDAAIQREWTLSTGRRTALARLAHLFAELLVRLEVVDLAEGNSYAFPVTQSDLADATGLTSVHVNRMLRELRTIGAMTFRDGRVVIEDLALLHRTAAFDPAYLYLDRQPR